MKNLTLLTIALFCLSTVTQAAVRYWTNNGQDGLWSNPSNWSGNKVPTQWDFVEFSSFKSDDDCKIDTLAVVTEFLMTGGYQGTVVQSAPLTIGLDGMTLEAGTFEGGRDTVSCNGDLIMTGGTFDMPDNFVMNSADIKISGGAWQHATGKLIYNGSQSKITYQNNTFTLWKFCVNMNSGQDLDIDGNTVLNVLSKLSLLDGGLDQGDGVFIDDTLYMGTDCDKWNAGNVEFSVGGDNVLINKSAKIDPFPNDLVINVSNGESVLFGSNGTHTYVGLKHKKLYVNSGTLTFADRGTIDLEFKEIYINAGAEINFQGEVNLTVERLYNLGGKISNNGGTVKIEMGHDLELNTEPGDRFPDLYISIDSTGGGNTVEMIDQGDTLWAEGDVTVLNGKIQNGILATEGNLFVHESWDKFDDTEIMFTGDARQTWESYTKADRYEERIIINKTNNEAVELLTDIHLKKGNADLHLLYGIIHSSQDAMLILDKDTEVFGGHNFSYVYGPLRKIGKKAFEFPVGKNFMYAPISISAPSDDKHHFTAEYFIGDPTNAGYDRSIKEPGIDDISNCEYWILDRTNGTSNVEVTLSSGGQRSCYMGELDSMYVLRWDGSMWRNHGNGGTTGSYEDGTFKTAGLVTNFSPFGGGGGDNGGILSTRFIDCTAEVMGAEVLVQWRTAVENSAAYFKVERSKNGIDWEEVGMEVAVGTSSEVNNYNTTDWNPWKGDTYYRVIEVDELGNEIHSPTAMVNVASGSIGQLVIYPNPSNGSFTLELNNGTTVDEIHVRNILGQEVPVELIDRSSSIEISINRARNGTYFVNVRTGSDTQTYPITINQ